MKKNPPFCISVTGVQGAGKSFLCKNIISSLQSRQIETACYGDVMTLFMKNKDHDSIPHLTNDELLSYYPKASKYLVDYISESQSDLFLIQNHLSVRGGGKRFDKSSKFEKFFVRAFLVVEPPESLIIERRDNDDNRNRPVESLNHIKQHQGINRNIAKSLSKEMSVPLLFVDNIDYKVTVDNILNWINEIM